MLEEAGLDLTRLQPEVAWSVFKAFAAEPVEGMSRDDDSDMCLFQCGVYDWSDGKGPRFHWGMTRQFSFEDEDGEYDHMEQLECGLYFDPSGPLASVHSPGIWSGADLDGWISAVESDDGFQAVLRLLPLDSSVSQEEV